MYMADITKKKEETPTDTKKRKKYSKHTFIR